MRVIHWKVLRRTLPADLDTPVSAFLKLRPLGASFLLESVERGAILGRYSFIGLDPLFEYHVAAGGGTAITRAPDFHLDVPAEQDPLGELARFLKHCRLESEDEDLALLGGAVGHLGYDYVRSIERLAEPRPAPMAFPLAQFNIPQSLVIFDHLTRRMSIVTLTRGEVRPGPGNDQGRPDTVSAVLQVLGQDSESKGRQRIDEILAALDRELAVRIKTPSTRRCDPEATVSPERYAQMVTRAKQHIRRGDIFQAVLSQSLVGTIDIDPFDIYRALRMLNPSPYMFFLDRGQQSIVGSSPEVLVKLQNHVATIRPIAGTRARGRDADGDRALERELLADEKEKAEHIMLVDLGRNDLGRVCEFGSVKVTDLMTVERYSHVMHLVSYIRGRLRSEHDCFDLLRASFPAGTVSGAPKVRAMQVIDALELHGRGPYAGAVGYFGIRGDMDLCITIRTVFVDRGKVLLQAGAGIVADSEPAREHQECRDKMAALQKAIAVAEEGLR